MIDGKGNDKVQTFMRLCDEAAKRHAKMRKTPISSNEWERWMQVYKYKLEQLANVGNTIRGDEAYYSIVTGKALILSESREADDNAKIIDAALNEAKRILIKLNNYNEE